MTCKTIAFILNSLGIVLNIAGVIALFKLRDKGLTSIKSIFSPNYFSNHTGRDFKQEVDNAFKYLTKNINTVIEDANMKNTKIFRKSQLWLIIIVVGSLLQFLSSYIQLQNN